jgi:uncharacterized OsmC-like protein
MLLLVTVGSDNRNNPNGQDKSKPNLKQGVRIVYHIDLDLSPEQVKQLKRLAIDRDLSVKELVTQVVKNTIEPKSTKAIPVVPNKPSK